MSTDIIIGSLAAVAIVLIAVLVFIINKRDKEAYLKQLNRVEREEYIDRYE